MLVADPNDRIIESQINVSDQWAEGAPQVGSKRYPTPGGFDIGPDSKVGPITVDQDWLRFDPLEVIPQPFRWFIRRVSKPQRGLGGFADRG